MKESAVNDLVAFVGRFGLSNKEAEVLPALFDNAASKVGRSAEQLVCDATYHNRELGEYLASIAKTVAAQV